MTLTNNWEVETIDDVRTELTQAGVPVTLIQRGIRRMETVSDPPTGYRGWIVEGQSRLDDKFPAYHVLLNGKVYQCGCYGHNFGKSRQDRFCSHVIAVLFARRVGTVSPGMFNPKDILLVNEPPEVDTFDNEFGSDFEPDHGTDPNLVAQEVATTVIPYPMVTPALTPASLGFTAPKFKDGFRPQQIEALRRTLTCTKKFIIIQAPPGVGKTLIAASIQRLTEQQTVYVCSNKDLQSQAFDDFQYIFDDVPYAVMFQGKSNYETLLYEWPGKSAEDCIRSRKVKHCHLCCDGKDKVTEQVVVTTPEGFEMQQRTNANCSAAKFCPYIQAKSEAQIADFPILNTTAFLYGTKYGGLYRGKQIPWLVIDEADLVEGELMNVVKLDISVQWAKKLGITEPTLKTVQESWIEWVRDEAMPAAQFFLNELQAKLPDPDEDGWDLVDTHTLQEVDWCERQIKKMADFLVAMEAGENWVWDSDNRKFLPVFVNQYGEDRLWDRAKKVVLMSATIISPQSFARDLGIPLNDYEFIDLASSFHPTRRSILYWPVAKNTQATKEYAVPMIADQVNVIAEKFPNQRVLVHTHSFENNRAVVAASQYPERIITYTRKQGERAAAIERYKQTPGGILVGPSLDRGLDLPDELARALVVTKVPYASRGDKQVAKRMYTGQAGQMWYTVKTIRSLVQMVGRGVRHDRDWCISYILDMEFYGLYQRNTNLFPKYFREAVIWDPVRDRGF